MDGVVRGGPSSDHPLLVTPPSPASFGNDASGNPGAAAAPARHVLRTRPEAELALLLVVARLLPLVLALAAVGRQFPAVGALAPDAAFGVPAKAVGAKTDFFNALVDVDAAVAVAGEPVALRTLALMTTWSVLALSYR